MSEHLPSALRGTAKHIRECRNDNGNNPYQNLIVDSGYIDDAADEIDRLRQQRDRAVELLREAKHHIEGTADRFSIRESAPMRWEINEFLSELEQE